MIQWYYPGGKAGTAFNDDTTHTGWAPQSNYYGGSALTLPAGTVTRLAGFTDSTSTASLVLKLGLYDSGGNLVVQGSVTLPNNSTKAWNIADVTDTAISAGTYYVLGSGSTSSLRYGYDFTGTGRFVSSAAHASAMAATVTMGDDTGLDYGTAAEVDDSVGGRTTKNTRGFTHGTEVGMNWRGTL